MLNKKNYGWEWEAVAIEIRLDEWNSSLLKTLILGV